MNEEHFVVSLARAIKSRVLEWTATVRERKVVGTAASGDPTFSVDAAAEETLEEFISKSGLSLFSYSEDKGLVKFGSGEPVGTLIVDPIDGTRPTLAGLGTACVSVALARPSASPQLKDVTHACLLELGRDALFYADAETGAKAMENGSNIAIRPSQNNDMESLRWSFEIVGRPVKWNIEIIGDLIDHSGIRGGVFCLNSTTYSLSRLVLGSFDAHVDIGGRVYQEIEQARPAGDRLGRGKALGLFAYDVVAAAFIARKAGCVVTDAWGQSLDDIVLTESRVISCVAAGTQRLHDKLMDYINEQFAMFRTRMNADHHSAAEPQPKSNY